ncbi:MAG: bifunctional oligoribonuclease/PAP phosphatase NrnA [Anaerolineales bacterium]|nr:bifunctional oligoribonuclease/PAP phosphatase NrnA [Anaerolineales bacterium]
MDFRIDPDDVRRAKELLERSSSVLLLTHQRPDGDALGSMLGLFHMLRAAGRQSHPILAEGMSSVFRYLPGAGEIRSELPAAFDAAVLVDCADRERISFPAKAPSPPINLAVDHHITNGRFAGVNLVNPSAAATAEFIVDLADGLGLTVTPEAAACLLAGVVTDTLGFRTPNTGRHTLEVVQRLMQAGGSLPETVERSLHRRSFAAARYWGAGLSRLERDGTIVWTSLTLADRSQAGYPGRDDADLVNILSSIDGHEAALIFIEQDGGKIKVSWRVVGGLDVTPLAASFGGGGHPAASGAVLSGNLEDVRCAVLQRTKQWLDAVHNGDNPETAWK